jgi:hypothetical protein
MSAGLQVSGVGERESSSGHHADDPERLQVCMVVDDLDALAGPPHLALT